MNFANRLLKSGNGHNLLNFKQSRTSFYNRYKHGPTKLSNPDPDYKQWVKDFFGPEGKEIIRNEARRLIKKPFRNPFKVQRANVTEFHEDFDSDESIKRWKPVADSDSYNGFSKSSLIRSKNGHGLFTGVLDSTLPEDGLTTNSGFAAIIGPQAPRDNMFATETHYDWRAYNCIEIKCRGDGRKYMVVCNTSTHDSDLEYYDAFAYPIYTKGGPYWQTFRIPFSKFIFTYKGLMQDVQCGLMRQRVKFVAITLEDKVDGPFALEIDHIGVRYETTPFSEYSSYEKYTFSHLKYRPLAVDCQAPETTT